MSFTAQEWKQDYETTKDLAIQLRTHGAASRSQVCVLSGPCWFKRGNCYMDEDLDQCDDRDADVLSAS